MKLLNGKGLNLIIFIVFIAMIFSGLGYTEKQYRSGESARLQSTIERAAVSCYSSEGFYPTDVAYLVEHYGIVIDSNKFHVFYDSMGSNMKPDVEVFRKGG